MDSGEFLKRVRGKKGKREALCVGDECGRFRKIGWLTDLTFPVLLVDNCWPEILAVVEAAQMQQKPENFKWLDWSIRDALHALDKKASGS